MRPLASTILAAALLPCLALAGAARGADLGGDGLRPGFAPDLPPAAFTWTGALVGVHLGVNVDGGSTIGLTGNDAILQSNTSNGLRPGGEQIHTGGFTGGAQAGYNYELRSPFGFGDAGIVVGVETDIAATGTSGSVTATSDRASTFASRTDFLGTLRARVGYASGRVLVYGTGGFAYGGTADNTSFLNGVGRQIYHGSSDTIRTGYAVGGGVEVGLPGTLVPYGRLNGDVVARLEFLHYELGATANTLANNDGLDPGYTQRTRNSGTLVRAGLSYKFGTLSAPAPVVARY